MFRQLLVWSLLLSFFMIGCEGDGLGCSEKKSDPAPEFHLQLGALGETTYENQLPKNENTHVLEAGETIEFLSDDGQALIRHSDTRDIQEDDVVIANEDQGYLLKVKEIIDLTATETEVVFQQARIADIVGDDTGSFSFETTPLFKKDDPETATEEMSFNLDDQGRLLIEDLELFKIEVNQERRVVRRRSNIMGQSRPNFRRQGIHFNAGAAGTYSATINSAEIQIIPTIRSQSDWNRGRLEESHTRLDTLVKYRVDISFKTSGSLSFNALIKNFLPKKKIPIRIPGAVPVYLDIELAIPAGLSVNTENEGTTRIVYEADYEFYSMMLYNRGQGIKVDKNQNVRVLRQELISQETRNKVNAELFLQPKIVTRLYRVLGPYAYLRPYIKGDLDWPSEELSDDLFVGITGGVGLEVSEPILTSEILNFDSGKIFEFQKSFDIDGAGRRSENRGEIAYDAREEIDLTQLTNEGFILLDLKASADNSEVLRFEMIEFPKNHLIVPSDNFYYDGRLFFYPLSKEARDQFSYRVISPSGETKDLSVEVQLSQNVLDSANQERFGLTTNSHEVASTSPGNFADQVPRVSVGLGGHRVAAAECYTPAPSGNYDPLNPMGGLRAGDCESPDEDEFNGPSFLLNGERDQFRQDVSRRFSNLLTLEAGYFQRSAIIDLQNDVFETRVISNTEVGVLNRLRQSGFLASFDKDACIPRMKFEGIESVENPEIKISLETCENQYDIPQTIVHNLGRPSYQTEPSGEIILESYYLNRWLYQGYDSRTNYSREGEVELCVYFPFDHKEERVLISPSCPSSRDISAREQWSKDELPRYLLPQFKVKVTEEIQYNDYEQKMIKPVIEVVPLNWNTSRPNHAINGGGWDSPI